MPGHKVKGSKGVAVNKDIGSKNAVNNSAEDTNSKNRNNANQDNNHSNKNHKCDKCNNGESQEKILYWSIAFVVAVILLLFASSRFYSNEEEEYESITYNNWEFTRIAGMWWFEWQKGGQIYQIPLRFNPYEAKEVPVVGEVNTSLFNAENYVYITFDFDNESSQDMPMLALAAAELTQNMAAAISRNPIAACSSNSSEVCIGRPVKTCSNTDEPVIFLIEGKKEALILDGSCIIVQGEGIGLVKAVDRLLYHWYRIL